MELASCCSNYLVRSFYYWCVGKIMVPMKVFFQLVIFLLVWLL
jgi:hypothetical protein